MMEPDAPPVRVVRSHAPGRPWGAVRSHYEGLHWMAGRGTDEGRRKLPGSGRAMGLPVCARKLQSRGTKRH